MRLHRCSLTGLGATLALSVLACIPDFDGSTGDPSSDPVGDPTLTEPCPESPASDLLDAALCVCEDFEQIGNLLVGQSLVDEPARAAINGHVTFANNTHIRGELIAYGGLDAAANLVVDDNTLSDGNVGFAGRFHVGGDLSVGGDLHGAGVLAVEGLLRLAGNDGVIGYKAVGGIGAYEGLAGPPCGCGPDEVFDVAGAVAAARTDNDNAAAGLPSNLGSIGWTRVGLSSGRYYFGDFGTVGATVLDIQGTVAIYIDGDLESVGAEWIHIRPGATLDMYVAGGVKSIGHVSLGDASNPSAFRLYVGGDGAPLISVGNKQFNGAIYAPRAVVRYIGNTNIRGALFARDLEGTGNLTIGYAAPIDPPNNCDPPDAEPDPDPEPEDPDDPIVVL